MSKKIGFVQLLTLQLLLLPVILLSISALLFCTGVPISAAHFLVSLAAAAAISFMLARKHPYFKVPGYFKNHNFLKVTAVFIILIFTGLFISMYIYDFSQDGQAYHQPAVIALAKGWNPFHEPYLEKYDAFYKEAMAGNEIYANHYTKGSWITAAAVYRLTGSLESGKMFNFFYLAACFLITWNFLHHFRRVPGKAKLVIAALTALNPVALYQLSSFYNDCQMASLLSIVLILSFEYILFREKKTLFFLALSLPILINIKFTGLIYSAVIICLAWLTVFILDRDRQTRFVLTMGLIFLAAVFIIGFQPYVTNLISKGNPFYPALRFSSTAKTGIETVNTNQTPAAFMAQNRFGKLFYSLFSRSDSDLTHMPQLKIPFTIKEHELSAFHVTDTRYGGFGPLFGSILLLVIPGACILLLKAKRLIKWFTFIVAGVITIPALINPEVWWARLSPQLWLLPITFIVAFYYLQYKYCRIYRGLTAILLLINIIITASGHFGHVLHVNRQFKRQMVLLANKTHQTQNALVVYPDVFYLVIRERLHDFKIKGRLTMDAGPNIQALGSFPGTPNTKMWLEYRPGLKN